MILPFPLPLSLYQDLINSVLCLLTGAYGLEISTAIDSKRIETQFIIPSTVLDFYNFAGLG